MRFEDFRIMDRIKKDEEEEILNAGLTPCSHTTTTKDTNIYFYL